MNLNQITVPVTNLERSIAFYETLGLVLIVNAPPHYARFECPEGETTFSLHLEDKTPGTPGPWIYFEVQELDACVAALIQKGLVFEELPNDKPWLWREARLKDPDQNQLILFWGGENRKNPPWRLTTP
mgnify:CR=1 FL=1